MNLNFEIARELMVLNQLKPNKISDQNILNIFKYTPKENFLPEKLKNICYSDNNINLFENRGYLKNLHLAQIIKYAEINKSDKVLHVGGLTGYLSLIIAKFCHEIIIIEENENLIEKLKNNFKTFKILNAEIVKSKLDYGYGIEAPYDLIIIDSPVYNFNNKLVEQLNPNQGRLIYIQKLKNDLSKAFKLTRNSDAHTNEYLFDVFSSFSSDEIKSTFKL